MALSNRINFRGGQNAQPRIKYQFSGISGSNDLMVYTYENDVLKNTERVTMSSWGSALWSSQYLKAITSQASGYYWIIYANGNITANNVNYNLNQEVGRIQMNYAQTLTFEVEFQ